MDTIDSRLARCVDAVVSLLATAGKAEVLLELSRTARPPTTCSAVDESPLCNEAVARAVASLMKPATSAATLNAGHVTTALVFAVAVAQLRCEQSA